MQPVSSFYDLLADDYDSMTGLESRFDREKPFFESIIQKYNLRSAIDAGCGTGCQSVLLAKLGIGVIAVDVSSRMLMKAIKNFNLFNVTVQTVKSDFIGLKQILKKKYDAIFSMGNSLVHLKSQGELYRTLKSFYYLLKNGGVLVTQTLNYDSLFKSRERVHSVRQFESKTIVRFFDYAESMIQFNILSINKTDKGIDYSISAVQQFPLMRAIYSHSLKESGFRNVKYFGGTDFSKFSLGTSKDLVVIASK
jgi:ubiquinone/menaquinone biosynthesis C-methylase UbiE